MNYAYAYQMQECSDRRIQVIQEKMYATNLFI